MKTFPREKPWRHSGSWHLFEWEHFWLFLILKGWDYKIDCFGDRYITKTCKPEN